MTIRHQHPETTTEPYRRLWAELTNKVPARMRHVLRRFWAERRSRSHERRRLDEPD
jgi:hypothetical protein